MEERWPRMLTSGILGFAAFMTLPVAGAVYDEGRRVITTANFYQGGGSMVGGRYVPAPLSRMWFYEAEFSKVGPGLVEPLSLIKDNEIVLTDNFYANPFSKNTIQRSWGK